MIFPNRTPNSRNNGTWFHLSVDGLCRYFMLKRQKHKQIFNFSFFILFYYQN